MIITIVTGVSVTVDDKALQLRQVIFQPQGTQLNHLPLPVAVCANRFVQPNDERAA